MTFDLEKYLDEIEGRRTFGTLTAGERKIARNVYSFVENDMNERMQPLLQRNEGLARALDREREAHGITAQQYIAERSENMILKAEIRSLKNGEA